MKKPNILLLFTDDQRFNTIGAINNRQIKTPNLDRLCKDGTYFTDCYIQGGSCPAVCMPSRAMLHTGRDLFSIEGSGESIPDEHILLGEHLQRSGYSCFGTGKWHNGKESYLRSFSSGAEIFFGGMDDHWNVPACRYPENGIFPDEQPAPWADGTGNIEQIPKVFDHIESGKHSTDLFADAAVDFLNHYNREKPFFLYTAFMAPHDPRTMPEKYHSMYDPDEILLPDNFMNSHPFDNGELDVRDEHLAAHPRDEAEIRRHLAEYYAMITHLDDAIGSIFDALKACGEFDNTLIILAGDNGLALGSHGLMGKQNLYEHSIHVPLIMSGPGVPRDRECEAPVYLYDLFPTLCDYLQIKTPSTVKGKSFAGSFVGSEDSVRRTMFYGYRDYQRALRSGRYKLIVYLVQDKIRIQIFDLASDPLETRDLSKDQSLTNVSQRLRRELLHEMSAASDPAYRNLTDRLLA